MRIILTSIFLMVLIHLNAQVVNEDFNASDGMWTVSSDAGNNLWQHGTPAGTAISDDNGGGGNAWVTGLSGAFTLTGADLVYLTSTAYDLSTLSTEGSISVAINMDIFGGDWAYVEYSTDNGMSWNKLGASGSGTNWYDNAFDEVWTTTSNSSGAWFVATQNLPMDALGASSVTFRFILDTVEPAGTYGAEGFAIDDFQILNTNTSGGGGPGPGPGGTPGTTLIKTMTLAGEIFPAVVDSTSSSVKLFVSPTTDVTALAPTFTLSDGATVDLASGSTQDFTSPVTYTVTSGGGMENTAWKVSAVVPNINLNVYPQSGVAGTTVTVLGRGFSSTPSENVLTLGGSNVSVVSATSTKLTFQIPSDASLGRNAISLSVNGLNAATGTTFDVLSSNVTGIFFDYRGTDFNLNASSYVNSMEVGDIDNDGDLDLVFDNETILNIATLENGRIQSTATKVTDRNNGATSFDDITLVDVDQDGFLDVVAGGVRVGWYKNNGDGTWADEVIIDQTSSDYTLRVFDLDGDFDFDILAFDDFQVSAFTNDGSGSFGLNDETAPRRLGPVIDWDEDGDMDILMPDASNQNIVVSKNDGLGNFTEETLATRSAMDLSNLQFGDLDNDGDLDFVIATANGGMSTSTMAYMLNNGDNTFTAETSFITEGAFTTKRLELSDLNNDGFLDVARTRTDGGTNSSHIYLSTASLTYSISEVLDSSSGGLDLVLVDIDRDGDMDVLHEASQSGGYFPLFLKQLQNAEISGFSMTEQVASATIDSGAGTVTIEVVASADVTSLTPTIGLSPSAGISPNSGVAQDFTNPVVYTVTAEDGVTTKDWTISVSQVPSIPVASAGSVTQESVDVSWSVANNAATGFELELSTASDFSAFVTGFDPLVINSGSTLNASLSGLSAGTTYYTRVRAKNALNTYSAYSSTINFLTISGTPVATPPTNVVTDSFVANWNAATGADNYTLEVSTDNFTTTVFTVNTTETNATVTGLIAGTTYKYRVLSTNATGSSPTSNEVTVTTNVVPTDLTMGSQSVNENQPLGTVVGDLRTEDLDDNTHTYTLVSGIGDTDNSLFSIDGTNLITNTIFNFESQEQYSVLVQTTDPKGASISKSFTINILDLNDAPTAIAVETSSFSPKGYDPVGTKVADLFATDEDGDVITFSLVNGGDSFSVNNTTMSLSTAVIFETEVDLVIPITLRATDPEGASFDQNFNITIGAFVDTEAPQLAASPQNSATFLSGGPELTLSVTVTDFRLQTVNFYSRLLTEPEFTSEALTEQNGSYSRTIMEADLGVAGIEYYFEAIDEAGNTGFTQLQTMALAFPESGENAPKVESVTKFGRTVDSYQIISIPFAFSDPAAKRVDAIFNEFSGDQINREYRIIRWDPTQGTMGELSNLSPSSTIELGEGYFFISAKERSITIESANINLQDPFPLELKQGWNLVGNPYNLDINWTSVLTNNNTGNIVGPLRVLDPQNPETWPESNILKELEGAFVFSTQDITLNLSYTDASITFGGRRAPARPEAEWFFPITLEQNGDFRKGGIGMDRRAYETLDGYDEPVMPKWLEYLEIAFLHEGERFSKYNRDVVPSTDFKIWDFEVSSSTAGISELKWDPESSPVQNMQLLDVASGRIIDMTKQSSYSFELNENDTKDFKILYSNDMSDQFDFGEVQILDAYPNPFQTSFKIPVRVPVSDQNQTIRVNLLDLSGKKLWSSSTTPIIGGAHEFEVTRPEGLDAGVYLYEVAVTEGSNTHVYTKRILLR